MHVLHPAAARAQFVGVRMHAHVFVHVRMCRSGCYMQVWTSVCRCMHMCVCHAILCTTLQRELTSSVCMHAHFGVCACMCTPFEYAHMHVHVSAHVHVCEEAKSKQRASIAQN